MRKINVGLIENKVYELAVKANYLLPLDIREALINFYETEKDAKSKNIYSVLCRNFEIASNMEYPLCQDTGLAVVFMEIGQDVCFTGGNLKSAVNRGIAAAYSNEYLRKSVVLDPLDRVNSNDNTPCILYTDLFDGDKVKISVMPKGFGAENQSNLKMMLPTSSAEEIADFIASGIINTGGKACPPSVIGVGIGGTFEYSAYLSKKALLLPVSYKHKDQKYREIENTILEKVNSSNIGAVGLGGGKSIISVNILTYPTHIAGLPVAYNYCCHSCRHAESIL